ncbi:hypothetical protein CYMTET_21943 [Cymbomonas tetramitiformis]|uniref:Response regulatory domain-containing protein n=1 Tax=Cymbomonas tetramitiformis TaxID=36881 RepID=A0AAE0G1U3_9CHLO|nr:hypothetical protein CYMTET_21943 [Cymbomonas tetramitiformis]
MPVRSDFGMGATTSTSIPALKANAGGSLQTGEEKWMAHVQQLEDELVDSMRAEGGGNTVLIMEYSQFHWLHSEEAGFWWQHMESTINFPPFIISGRLPDYQHAQSNYEWLYPPLPSLFLSEPVKPVNLFGLLFGICQGMNTQAEPESSTRRETALSRSLLPEASLRSTVSAPGLPSTANGGFGRRALLVQANPEQSHLESVVLARFGIMVTTVPEAEDALHNLQQGHTYSMVFIRIDGPEMTHSSSRRMFEVLNKIRQWERQAEVPPNRILALSSEDLTNEAVRSMGMNEYLKTPFTPQAVRNLLMRPQGSYI